MDRGLGVGMEGMGICQALPEQDPGMGPAAHRGLMGKENSVLA